MQYVYITHTHYIYIYMSYYSIHIPSRIMPLNPGPTLRWPSEPLHMTTFFLGGAQHAQHAQHAQPGPGDRGIVTRCLVLPTVGTVIYGILTYIIYHIYDYKYIYIYGLCVRSIYVSMYYVVVFCLLSWRQHSARLPAEVGNLLWPNWRVLH